MIYAVKKRIVQLRQGKVPKGYKNCKNVVIPQTWIEVSLGELGESKNGLNFSRDDEGYSIRVLGVGDFKDKTVMRSFEKLAKVSLVTDPTSDCLLQNGDIVFVRSNGSKELVGRNLLVYPNDAKVSYSGFCIRYRMRDTKLTIPEYLNFILDSGVLKKKLRKENQGSNINNLNQDILSELIVALPVDRNEQNGILQVLKLQDKVIELKEKRLAEKQRQKKYLMQQLLTGKKRLKGFNGEWRKEKLGKFFAERSETECEHLELLDITGMQGVIPRSHLSLKDNSSEDRSKYLRICVGDIGYNTMRMWQGVSAYSNYDGIVSPAYTILKSKGGINAKYFAYLFKLPEVVFLFYRYSQGLVDDTRNLKYENFKKISVAYPEDIEEQNAIASVLEVADKEIELHRQDLEQEKQKKKALMQLLLTGIVRVPVKGDAVGKRLPAACELGMKRQDAASPRR